MTVLYRLPLALSLMLVVAVASAEGVTPHDYYSGNYDPTLLDNVEKFHLPKARRQMKSEGTIQWAQQDIEFVLAWFPNHPEALQLASQIANMGGTPKAADKYYIRALQMYGDSGMTRLLYGLHLHRSGRIDQAIEAYHKAISLAPDNANAYYNLGLALLSQGKVAEAREAAKQAYALGHPLPGLRRMLAKHARQGE